jgi:hypothetical protein
MQPGRPICVDDDPSTIVAFSRTLASVVRALAERLLATGAAAWNQILGRSPYHEKANK